jgi:probable rRNA maturation factor
MTIMIDDRRDRPDLPAETERLLERILRMGIERTDGPRNVQVSLLLTGDAQIREMNREFRGVDRSTDVLSFPMLDYLENGSIEDEQLVYETEPETEN